MTEILNSLAGNLMDVLVYGAILVIALTGLSKCILAGRRCTRILRRAVRRLEMMTLRDGTQNVWQDPLFLGKPLQNAWKRFLINAEQLDSRGLNCDVEDYINEESVIYAHCHTQLGEIIPGVLTSLGILGTFLGLVRGLGALNLTDASSTMAGISDMISGMNFAFGTSIAGCACSLLFNLLNRAAIGSTQKALDEFYEAFTEFVMQQPLRDEVQSICQREDQAAFLRQAVGELTSGMTEGVRDAVAQSMMPVTQSVSRFIASETQTQLEGLNTIVNSFVTHMNAALGGEFTRLGQTLSSINSAQRMDYETLHMSLDAAAAIMSSMQEANETMHQITARLESYSEEMLSAREEQGQFAEKTQDLIAAMHAAAQEQTDYMLSLRAAQDALQSGMQEYAQWSGRVLDAVHQQSGDTAEAAKAVSGAMKESSQVLSESYAAFVENISTGLARTMGMFEENMHAMVSLLDGKLESLEKTARTAQHGYNLRNEQLSESTQGLLTTLSRMQRALGDMTACVTAATDALKLADDAPQGA